MNKIQLESINTNFLNQYNATPEELLSEAMDQFGLIDEETKINDIDAREYLKTLQEKKKSFREINRKASFFTKIGTLLLQKNVINNMQLKEALSYQKHTPIKIGEILVKLGFVDEHEIAGIVEEQKKIRHILEKLTTINKMDVTIDYREPLFEKHIGRVDEEPFEIVQTVETSDISDAIIEALSIFYSNERLSSVHWQSEIIGLKISINLIE